MRAVILLLLVLCAATVAVVAAAPLPKHGAALLAAVCTADAAAGKFAHVRPYDLEASPLKLVVVPNTPTHLQAAQQCAQSIEIDADSEAYLFRAGDWARTAWIGGQAHFIHKSNQVIVIIPKASLAGFAAVKADRERLRVIPNTATFKGVASPIKFQKKNVSKTQMINSINSDQFYSIMEGLTGVTPIDVGGRQVVINTRYTLASGNDDAATYTMQFFRQAGYTDVRLQPFNYAGKTTNNIVAVKRGTTSPNEIIVVGAHMDSTSPSASTNAPGCIDNGSGTGAVMSVAHAMANVTSARTIYYVLFSAEEQGLIGSEYFVEQAQDDNLNIVAALTMDMIGYSNRFHGVLIEGTTDPDIRALMDNFEKNINEFAADLTYEKTYYSYGSDHVSFQRAGIPAFLAIEQDNTDYPGYHQTTDRINYLSVEQSMGIMRGIAGSLWDYAESIQ